MDYLYGGAQELASTIFSDLQLLAPSKESLGLPLFLNLSLSFSLFLGPSPARATTGHVGAAKLALP